jgi:non-homologous end joining protein Ku
VFEVIEPKAGQTIKLNEYIVKGYTIVNEHIITIDGKEIKISEESFNELKKQLN